MSEGMPQSAESRESEAISEDAALEAMKAGDFESVRKWYAQEELRADKELDGGGRTLLTMKLGRMQLKAGFRDEGLDSLYAAREDAANQRQDALVATIEEAIRMAERL